jgi:hypothetical protein
MYKITSHPILDLPKEAPVEFLFEGHKIKGIKGHTIAAALHQADIRFIITVLKKETERWSAALENAEHARCW